MVFKICQNLDRLKSKRSLSGNYRVNNKTEWLNRNSSDTNNFIVHKHLKELKMPEFINRDSDNWSGIRWSDINFNSNKGSWLSKNVWHTTTKWYMKDSFMPSLAPLPSLMKKFGDQTKEEKKRREYPSSHFRSPLLISNNRQGTLSIKSLAKTWTMKFFKNISIKLNFKLWLMFLIDWIT